MVVFRGRVLSSGFPSGLATRNSSPVPWFVLSAGYPGGLSGLPLTGLRRPAPCRGFPPTAATTLGAYPVAHVAGLSQPAQVGSPCSGWRSGSASGNEPSKPATKNTTEPAPRPHLPADPTGTGLFGSSNLFGQVHPPDDRGPIPDMVNTSGGGLSHRLGTLRPTGTRRGRIMAVSLLFRIDGNGHIEVVDGGPAPAVSVDADRAATRRIGDHHPRRRRPRRGAMALAVMRRPTYQLPATS